MRCRCEALQRECAAARDALALYEEAEGTLDRDIETAAECGADADSEHAAAAERAILARIALGSAGGGAPAVTLLQRRAAHALAATRRADALAAELSSATAHAAAMTARCAHAESALQSASLRAVAVQQPTKYLVARIADAEAEAARLRSERDALRADLHAVLDARGDVAAELRAALAAAAAGERAADGASAAPSQQQAKQRLQPRPRRTIPPPTQRVARGRGAAAR
jgi:hypothetical protein